MLRLMRTAGEHERVARVNSRSFATLTLDFDLNADPVAGVVRTGADRGDLTSD